MKRVLMTGLLLLLAVAVGLMLPGAVLTLQDRSLNQPESLTVTEPTLVLEDPSKSQEADAAAEPDSEAIAERLQYFETGPSVSMPLGTATTDDVLWATSRAVEFLNLACEEMPDVSLSEAEYQLAWFEDGTTIPFWTAYVEFNDTCRCIMTIDGESGAILQLIIKPNGADLAELFPESFRKAATEPDADFEKLVAQRFCDALGYFMGRNDGGPNPVTPIAGKGAVTVSFADRSDIQIELFFTVDLSEGINFNNPREYGP